jgi:hypothetical protein
LKGSKRKSEGGPRSVSDLKKGLAVGYVSLGRFGIAIFFMKHFFLYFEKVVFWTIGMTVQITTVQKIVYYKKEYVLQENKDNTTVQKIFGQLQIHFRCL